ncbi:2,5-dichloro-2,5-cyclohexadiene-1,4-diol dehydrogenase [Parvularcula bermudensis HTCC2503]|uniref:2,5-dichloro-2,5-cyclohexadiene-1,4-diol dehydrogenase n=1 Tax=Parvularcula bermudensis (strain ATCC BAA-594 / HTCC2503 / KCTC 12087) TaxID=314260 RepID=E0TGL2_PARBH|nr:SDR family oxidoreductase [Parvularcula bermudensis]ADM10144.1 2,5-dichloro-2,5-cyclohexadiene-1,4-diol dehydrogenase [Parvularcula bermudensis HTCC2503]
MTSQNQPRLDGKRALITGGAQGLGYALAERFLKEGARVVITDVQGDKVSKASQDLGADAGLTHDVSDPEAWKSVVARANATMNGINVLVHNAGVASFGDIERESFDTYRRVMAIDCDSIFLGTQAALPYLRDNGPSSIIVMSSVAAMKADRNLLAYNTAKAAATMMTKSIALHCAKSGYDITCNSVHPVFIRTPIIEPMIAMKGNREEGEKALTRQIPMKRLGEPDEVASMLVYLASDESRFVTGSAFTIDGGITAT